MTQALIKALAVMAVAAVANTAHAQQNRGDIRWEPVQVILPSGEQKQYVHSPNDPNELQLPPMNGWECSVWGSVEQGEESQFISCTSDKQHYTNVAATCHNQRIGELSGAHIMLDAHRSSGTDRAKSAGSIVVMCAVYQR
jgi:hypothetical protein